jgi:trigger factor
MQVTKKDLEKSQIELTVEFSAEEFQPYIEKGTTKISEKVKIEGFRPGKAPLEVLKAKVGEMSIMEEAANIAIKKTIDDIIEQNTMGRPAVGQPKVEITKLAPGNPVEFKIILSIMPTVALGKYKDLNIKVTEAKVEEADIEKTLKELQEMRVKEVISEEAVADGDKVLVDVEMFMEKVPLEGGQTKGLAVIIGKNYFVAGFDKNLLGAKKGDDRDFSLPFPTDHHQQNLAGKMVDFKVKISEVYTRELPEVNDEFATGFRFENLADLRKAMTDNILADRTNSANQKTEIEMLEAIINDTKFGEIPESMVESETHHMLHEIEDNLTHQGSKMADYLQHLNKTKEQFALDLVPSALKRVKTALAMKEVGIVEKIEVSAEEIEKKIVELKETHKHDKSLDDLAKDPAYLRYLGNVLQNEKVLNKLKEWNYADSGKKQKS